MACGTAVVTTDNGGNRDYTKNRENCLLVPPSDIKQLTLALSQLLTQEKYGISLLSPAHNLPCPGPGSAQSIK